MTMKKETIRSSSSSSSSGRIRRWLLLLLLSFALFVTFTFGLRLIRKYNRKVRNGPSRKAARKAKILLEPTSSPLPTSQYSVPSHVHYIFGMEPTFGHMSFGLMHYISILGTVLYIKPERISWHHRFLPNASENVWWSCAQKHVMPREVGDVTMVHGRFIPSMHVAHKADILRMQIMREEGGIYVDSDVIPLRSFDELRRLAGNKLVMGKEEAAGQSGMANAVLVGAPNSSFINRWWEHYKDFEGTKGCWACHSVLLPKRLAGEHPEEIVILGPNTFFRPTWAELKPLYEIDDQYDYIDNFAVHLWTSQEAKSYNRLTKLAPADVWSGKGSFHRVARRVLADAAAAGLLCDAAKKDMPVNPPREKVGRG